MMAFGLSNIYERQEVPREVSAVISNYAKSLRSSGYQTTNEKNAARMAEIRDPQIAGNW